MGSFKITTRVIRFVVIMTAGLVLGVSCVPASTTSLPITVLPTLIPTKIIPTPTSLPTRTPLPPTDFPESKDLEIAIPSGNEATIDGVLSPEEWETAYQTELTGGGQLMLMHKGGYLYLGIRAKPEPVTSICVDHIDQVSILHSSAAIGTAIYQMGDQVWEQIRGFEWCCRDTTDSSQAQEARRTQLQQDGWIASNGRMGNPDEVEYQIAIPDGSLRLAVNSIGAPNYRSVISWPGILADDCSNLDMLRGPIPEQAQFSVEEWITLTVSTD